MPRIQKPSCKVAPVRGEGGAGVSAGEPAWTQRGVQAGQPGDPRIDQLPAPDQKLTTVIRALDGTWHRPFTTLELAALQSLLDPEAHLELEGLSDADWRERIGNAVPPKSAEAIAGVMGTTLLLAWSGATFTLGSTPIWVRNAAMSLALQTTEPPNPL